MAQFSHKTTKYVEDSNGDATLKVGSNIQGWTLVEKIGKGSMGEVWKATNDQNIESAIKFLTYPDAKTDASGETDVDWGDVPLQRFRREAEILKQINSQNIVRIIDCDVDGNRPFIATTFYTEPTLSKEIRCNGAWDLAKVHTLGSQLFSVLQQVHSKGIVHRDIKPANIIVAPETGSPVLLDFGIALFAQDRSNLTAVGSTLGTNGYIAPELLEIPTRSEPCAETDIWSLVCVLVFALTGHAAFVGTPTDMVNKIKQGRADLHDMPKALKPAFRRALSYDRNQRGTFLDLLHEIHQEDHSRFYSSGIQGMESGTVGGKGNDSPTINYRDSRDGNTKAFSDDIPTLTYGESHEAGAELPMKNQKTSKEVKSDNSEGERITVEAQENAVNDRSKQELTKNTQLPFDFLRDISPELAEIGNEAAGKIDSDPNAAGNNLRQFAQGIGNVVFTKLQLPPPVDDRHANAKPTAGSYNYWFREHSYFFNAFRKSQNRGEDSRRQWPDLMLFFRTLVADGNRASHVGVPIPARGGRPMVEKEITAKEARRDLDYAKALGSWLVENIDRIKPPTNDPQAKLVITMKYPSGMTKKITVSYLQTIDQGDFTREDKSEYRWFVGTGKDTKQFSPLQKISKDYLLIGKKRNRDEEEKSPAEKSPAEKSPAVTEKPVVIETPQNRKAIDIQNPRDAPKPPEVQNDSIFSNVIQEIQEAWDRGSL